MVEANAQTADQSRQDTRIPVLLPCGAPVNALTFLAIHSTHVPLYKLVRCTQALQGLGGLVDHSWGSLARPWRSHPFAQTSETF